MPKNVKIDDIKDKWKIYLTLCRHMFYQTLPDNFLMWDEIW